MINFKALGKADKIRVTYITDDVDSEYVKLFREKYMLSQQKLANLMGVSLRTVRRWEKGKDKISQPCCVLFTLFSHNENLIEQIRIVEKIKSH